MKETLITCLLYFHFCFCCLVSVGCSCCVWVSCSSGGVGCSVPQLAEAVKSADPFLLWGVKAAQKALLLPFISIGTK